MQIDLTGYDELVFVCKKQNKNFGVPMLETERKMRLWYRLHLCKRGIHYRYYPWVWSDWEYKRPDQWLFCLWNWCGTSVGQYQKTCRRFCKNRLENPKPWDTFLACTGAGTKTKKAAAFRICRRGRVFGGKKNIRSDQMERLMWKAGWLWRDKCAAMQKQISSHPKNRPSGWLSETQMDSESM